jgi:arylsulfatase A-like enzyme
LDGVNVWDTIAQGSSSPRTEIVYNIEPFRGAVRQGDWKLVWRTLLPSSVELFNLAQDPSEKNNLAAQHPEKVATLQQRIEALAKESAKPLFLVDQFKVVTKGMHGEPVLPTDDDYTGVEQP